MNRNHQMRRLDTKGQEALKRALSNPVKTEKPDKSTRNRRRRRSSAGTTSGGESPSAAAASTASRELDEDTRRRRFNAGKGNRLKNPYIPPKSRGLGLEKYMYREHRTDRPYGNAFDDDFDFDTWQARDMAASRKRRVKSAPDHTPAATAAKPSKKSKNEDKKEKK